MLERVLLSLAGFVYFLRFMCINTLILMHDAYVRISTSFDARSTLDALRSSPSTEIVPIGSFGATKSVAIITGGNSGIGLENAYHLARAGMLVIIACRSVERGREAEAATRRRLGRAAAGNVEFMQCDVGSFASVRRFADAVIARDLNVKLLMLNAGVLGTDFDVTAEGFEQQLGINHLGHALLVRKLLPLMKAKAPARIVSVGSKAMWGGHITDQHFSRIIVPAMVASAKRSWRYDKYRAYSDSKHAMLHFMLGLADELKAYNSEPETRKTGRFVTVCSFHPGCVRTAIVSNSGIPFARFVPSSILGLIMIPVEVSAAYAMQVCLSPAFDGPTALHGKHFDMMRCAPDDWWVARARLDEKTTSLVWRRTLEAFALCQ